jgi:DNA-binding NarL/FixJ family response regulator
MVAADPVRVAAVDDHPSVLAGVEAIVSADARLTFVAGATSHEDLLAAGIAFDVVLLDLYLQGDPRASRSADFDAVAALSPEHATLVYTGAGLDADIYDVVHRHPVAGYIGKDVPPDQLCDAIVRAAAGEMVLTQEYAAAVMRELEVRRTLEAIPPPTPREADVLRSLAEGLTDQQIARRLGIAPSTVNHYMKNLRVKLGRHAGNRWQLARMAFVLGLSDPPARRRLWSGRAPR